MFRELNSNIPNVNTASADTIYFVTMFAGTNEFKFSFAGSSRYPVFMIGSLGNTGIYGVFVISAENLVWSGTPTTITGKIDSSGQVTVTLPSSATGRFLLMSVAKIAG